MNDDDQPPRRVDLWTLFRVFLFVGLTALGGSASAHIHHAVVHERGWMQDDELLEGMTLARILPGANVSNLAAFVGSLLAGNRGALVAVCGVVLPGVSVLLGLALAYARLAHSGLAIVPRLHGLAAGAVGIMVSLVLDAARPVVRAPAGWPFAIAAFLAVGVAQVNLLAALLVLVPLASLAHRPDRTP